MIQIHCFKRTEKYQEMTCVGQITKRIHGSIECRRNRIEKNINAFDVFKSGERETFLEYDYETPPFPLPLRFR